MLDPLNLVLLVIALGVFWRFKSVLGSRTGEERPPADVAIFKPRKDRSPAAAETQANETVQEPGIAKPVWHGVAAEGSEVAKGLEAIVAAAPDFQAATFLEGAKRAYELILGAYAKGDKSALKPLLSKEVLESFSANIDLNNANGTSVVFEFVGVNSAKFEKAALDQRIATVTLRFNSEMIHALKDKVGEVIEGQDKKVRSVEDIWTFERDTASRDPNWKLAATDDDLG